MNQNNFNKNTENFNENLNKLVMKYKLCYSNIDENILRKAQQFEQEDFYHQILNNPNESFHIEDEDIKKTLDSGSGWMR